MPAKPLDLSTLQRALDAVTEHDGNVSQAARALGLVRGTFEHHLREARRRHAELTVYAKTADPEPVVGLPYEREWEVWQRYIGQLTSRYTGPCVRPAHHGRLRVVAAGDFHCPYHDVDALARLIQREKDRADVVVIGGDVNDAEAASTFTPRHKQSTFEEELAAMTFVFERLSEAFPRVLLLRRSNHSDGNNILS